MLPSPRKTRRPRQTKVGAAVDRSADKILVWADGLAVALSVRVRRRRRAARKGVTVRVGRLEVVVDVKRLDI